MDIFENITKKATETYKFASEKTEKIRKETKLKMTIRNNKQEIEDIYAEIGKKLYEDHLEGKDVGEKFIQDFIEIDTLASEIESARSKILELNNIRECEECYSQIDIEYKYCPICGKEQESVVVEKVKEETVQNENRQCECGHDNVENAEFCTECGKELTQDTAENQ